ncbi:MAG: hypothetical protein CfP315_0330 [Candidatus Improbicoccus pseudotrichonymphae]|uniref:Uncharacterized protein n=1 Tax=Candidatus Improbicoccus pseudotrichonymphae TaxID=3033792 RepID=A0AA48KZ05_9FIRM|nr:MAG: hypothetical protein CfP315_0330 [Candidatus Improbicoccus pseudotrichonymphae]
MKNNFIKFLMNSLNSRERSLSGFFMKKESNGIGENKNSKKVSKNNKIISSILAVIMCCQSFVGANPNSDNRKFVSDEGIDNSPAADGSEEDDEVKDIKSKENNILGLIRISLEAFLGLVALGSLCLYGTKNKSEMEKSNQKPTVPNLVSNSQNLQESKKMELERFEKMKLYVEELVEESLNQDYVHDFDILEKTFLEIQEKLAAVAEKLDANNKEIRIKLNQSTQSKKNLEKDVNQSTQAKEKLEKEINRLTQEEKKFPNEVSRITQAKKDFEEQVNEFKKNETMTKISRLQQEVTNLTTQVKQLEQEISELEKENLTKEVSRLTQEKKNLEEQVNQLTQEEENLTKEVSQSTQQKKDLAEEVSKLELEISQSTQQKKDLAEEVSKLELEISQSTQQKKDLAEEVSKLKLEISQSTQQKEDSAEEVSKLKQEISKLEKENTIIDYSRTKQFLLGDDTKKIWENIILKLANNKFKTVLATTGYPLPTEKNSVLSILQKMAGIMGAVMALLEKMERNKYELSQYQNLNNKCASYASNLVALNRQFERRISFLKYYYLK